MKNKHVAGERAAAPKAAPVSKRASVQGHPRRNRLPTCRTCPAQLTRRDKRTGCVICSACAGKLEETAVTFTRVSA